jgi:hypothetical protein
MGNLFKITVPESHRPLVNGTLRRVFVGEHGIRAGWSALLFVTVFGTLVMVVRATLGHFISLDATGPIPLSLGLLLEFSQLLVVAAATFVMARIEKRPLLILRLRRSS